MTTDTEVYYNYLSHELCAAGYSIKLKGLSALCSRAHGPHDVLRLLAIMWNVDFQEETMVAIMDAISEAEEIEGVRLTGRWGGQ